MDDRYEPSTRALQFQLLAAAVGAVIILLGLFGTVASIIGLILIVGGTVMASSSAPPPGQPGRGWWTMLAVGAGLSVFGALVSLFADTVGGLIAAIGGVLAIIAVALGFPLSGESPQAPARRRW